jgi:lipoprotein-anchoring transpeptidase ErfK/SrfK
MLALTALVLSASPSIEAWLAACPEAADGFSPVVGGRSARAAAAGEVESVSDGEVVVRHCFYENATPTTVRVAVRGLTWVSVVAGERVARGQVLGTGKNLVVTTDVGPLDALIEGRAALVVPRAERALVVVDVEGHEAALFWKGVEVRRWEVGHGQVSGPKEWRGDLKTPQGMYFVVQKSRGPFGGPWADYFGGAWVKVNYPNAFDAARGLDAGVITHAQADAIARAWSRRAPTLQNTALGGGIGFHGWNGPWDGADGGYGLSWGCVVVHPEEVSSFFDAVPLGAVVVLLHPEEVSSPPGGRCP